jgi:ABC-type uncharacterized transport system ATPase component
MSLDDRTLSLNKVRVTYSRWGQTVEALRDVSISVPQGQWVLVIGPNGAGKTTLLNVISSRMMPSSGEVTINGKALRNMGRLEIAANIFHVHQDPLLGTAPGLTVYENLFVADYEGQGRRESTKTLRKKYSVLLERVGLKNMLKHSVRDLSGGERQLITLLIASLRPAKIILLDEPLAALDPDRAKICIDEIARLNSEGRTIIQVTHDMDFANIYGDRVVVFREGRIVYDKLSDHGTVSQIQNVWKVLNITK